MCRHMLILICLVAAAGGSALWTQPGYGSDWPQLQHDAARTGRTTDSAAITSYRLRWLWMGPQGIVRNHLSNASWTGPDINPGDIVDLKSTLPTSVSYTITEHLQPIAAESKIFVGTMEGTVYAINQDDGTTVWTGSLPGGTVATGAYCGGNVVFGSLTGAVPRVPRLGRGHPVDLPDRADDHLRAGGRLHPGVHRQPRRAGVLPGGLRWQPRVAVA